MTPRALRSALAVDSQYAPFTRCLPSESQRTISPGPDNRVFVTRRANRGAATSSARLSTRQRVNGAY